MHHPAGNKITDFVGQVAGVAVAFADYREQIVSAARCHQINYALVGVGQSDKLIDDDRHNMVGFANLGDLLDNTIDTLQLLESRPKLL